LIRLILSNRGIQDAKIATERLFQVMDLAEEEMHLKIQDIKSAHKINIKAKNLSFRYPGKKELLRGISFICEPGTITAIAGESGSGKSTLLSLLLKFYSPESGSIQINGSSMDKISPSFVRQIISYVPQSVELFSGSLGYNISFESGTWNENRMNRCLELSGLNAIIKNLPRGLDTTISEDGNNFSGGEKQKIALARALYKEAGLIFLDEPSSHWIFNQKSTLSDCWIY
jgi:ATP-binding cassette subfamily B protein